MPGGRRAPNGSPKCRVISYSGQVGTGGRLCLHALHSTLGSKIAESDCYTEETIFETYITEEGVAYLLVLATTNSETGKSSLSCEFQAWCEHDKEAPMKNRFTVMEDWVHWHIERGASLHALRRLKDISTKMVNISSGSIDIVPPTAGVLSSPSPDRRSHLMGNHRNCGS